MKQFVKKFNNLIKKTIFKVENKTNNNFNRYLITFIASLFFYLFYLLIPLLYGKTWVQTNIERKLLNEFNINLSSSADISYLILPSPHFLIKDSRILIGTGAKKNSVAEIRDFKVFLSQRNFFDKEKINIKKIVINDANFSILRSNLKLFNKFKSEKFSNKKIKVNNSNIFLKDNLGEIISIIQMDKMVLFFDEVKLSNLLNLKGEIFNVPFTFDFIKHIDPSKYEKISLISKLLKLNISNKSAEEKNLTSGENSISFLRSTINTKYNFKEKLITFKSNNSRLNNLKVDYTGELSINPFDLDLNIHLDNQKISKLFNFNSILIEFIKSGLLFNDNISVNTSLIVNSNEKNEFFQNAKISFKIVSGKINFNKTKLINNDIGSLQFSNSNLFSKNNELIFISDILVDIKNSENLFSFLNTNKSSRKFFKTVLINLHYNISSNKIKFNDIKIDNNIVSDQFLHVIDGFNDNNSNNIIKSKRLINKLLSIYEG